MIAEIKIAGFGGQGVILSGIIIGRAASIFDNKFATLTQSFGPEARGSACSAQLLVSDEEIHYPYVTEPGVLVAMSQEAYTKFAPEVRQDGMVLYESDLVKPHLNGNAKGYAIPATRLAEELGRKMVLNIVMTGFFTAMTGLVAEQAMKDAIRESVPPGTERLNMQAFQRGFEYGKSLLA